MAAASACYSITISMIPSKPVTLDRFEKDVAILRTDDGQELLWPREKLPAAAKQGDVLSLALLTNTDLADERKKYAKTVLNEILGSTSQQ